MSQALRSFLHLLHEDHPNEVINHEWEKLSTKDQLEVHELADTSETIDLDMPMWLASDQDSIFALV